jgi:photosystem II stability/assembly factor-like uncharacterized protein
MKRILLFGLLAAICAVTAFAQSPWTKQTTPTTQRIRGFKVLNSQVLWASGNAGVVLRTRDGGTTWELRTSPNSGYDMYCIEALDSLTAWAFGTVVGTSITDTTRIWKTTDGGVTWAQQFQNTNSFADGIKFFDANNGVAWSDPMLTRKSYFVIVTTTNGGTTWTPVPESNMPPVDSVDDEVSVSNGCDAIGNTVWFVTYGNTDDIHPRVFKSTDRGLTWTASARINVANSYGFSMKDVNTGILSNISSGAIARTSNGWATADTVLLFTGTYGLRAVDWIPGTNGIVIVGGPSGTGFCAASTDGGTTWTQQTLPAGIQRLYVVNFLNPSLGWAAGNAGAILKWTGNPVVGVNENTPFVPEAFTLSQNYPNPFNPSTTIEYALPSSGMVQLKIYDMLGREVASLVDQEQTAGKYSVKFDARTLASGIYYYTLKSGTFVSTKSLVLVK